MRDAVIDEIERIAKTDGRIDVMTADLGYSVLENFAGQFPKRFYNVGISEQFMSSAAAGLALNGRVVFTYSIGNFATLRCIEQIRNDICYHKANVKIIAVGGGFSYGQLGMSHHATEDIAMFRALPNMRVLTPADPEEARAAVRYAVQTEGPCYIRLARRGEPILYAKAGEYCAEKVQTVQEGEKAALLLCGPLLKEGIKAAGLLAEEKINVGVYSVPCIKPLDVETIRKLGKRYPLLLTAEEHVTAGGLGGAVAEVIAGMNGTHASLIRLGLQDVFTSIVGSHDYLCDFYGISGEKIAQTVREVIGKE